MRRLFVVAGVVLLAGGAGAAEGPQLVFEPRARANELCKWDGQDWTCKGLDHFNVEMTGVSDGDSPVTMSARPIYKSGGCITALQVEVTSHQETLTVDWSKVAMAAGGNAVQVAPGFARRHLAGLSQRPSVAAPGMALRETVHPVDGPDDGCLIGPTPPADAPGDTLDLFFPHRVGESAHNVTFRLSRRWAGATEAQALSSMDEPSAGVEPIGSRPLWGRTPVVGGVPIGLLGFVVPPCASVLGCTVAGFVAPFIQGTNQNERGTDPASGGAAAFCFSSVCLGLPTLYVGFWLMWLAFAVDAAALAIWFLARKRFNERQDAHAVWDAKVRSVKAWHEKRARLGSGPEQL